MQCRTAGPTAAENDEELLVALRIQRRTGNVFIDDAEIALTPKEFDLLAVLAEEPGVVVGRQQPLDEVWDPHWYGPTKTIDIHVAMLRGKLGDSGLVATVRGAALRLGKPS